MEQPSSMGDRSTTRVLEVATFLPRSWVNGPGLRSVLWVQGCPFWCSGCFNMDFRVPGRGRIHAIDEVAGWMRAVTDAEGITVSGGEPFAQAGAVAELARLVRKAGKSVVVFTGYSMDDLEKSSDSAFRRLLDNADVLIVGPYEKDNPGNHPLLASGNQKLVYMTDRYRSVDFAAGGRRRVEYRIGRTGVIVTGFPQKKELGHGDGVMGIRGDPRRRNDKD